MLGVRESAIVEVPDIVLGMEPPTADAVQQACRQAGVSSGHYATMTVQLKNRRERRALDLEALARAAEVLLAQPNIHEVLVVDQAGDGADSRDLVARIGPRARLIADDLSPEELVALYGGSVITVACRLHSAIFSLVAGTPAIAISVTPLKAEGVYASVGLPPDWVVGIDEVGAVTGLVPVVLNHPAGNKEQIRAAVNAAALRLGPLRDRLGELLNAED